MTNTKYKVLNRVTNITHIETGISITIGDLDVQIEDKEMSHMEQRDAAINMLSKKLGTNIDKSECNFEFLVKEIE